MDLSLVDDLVTFNLSHILAIITFQPELVFLSGKNSNLFKEICEFIPAILCAKFRVTLAVRSKNSSKNEVIRGYCNNMQCIQMKKMYYVIQIRCKKGSEGLGRVWL